MAWLVAFAVLVPLSRWMWRRGQGGNFVKGLFFAAFTIPAIIVPGIAKESVRVGAGGLSLRTGFWFSPTERDYPFADLDEIVETWQEIDQREVERSDRVWTFRYRSGQSRRMKLSDLLAANREPVIEYLRRQGLAFREA